jgi:chromosome segregation ATPase
LGRVRVGCLEDFKDIDAKLVKANKLLVEGIRMVGKTEAGQRESRQPINDRPEDWLEALMENFEEGTSLGKILLNDIKILSNEKKKAEKKLHEETNKVKRFEVSTDLQRLVDSLNQVSMLLDSLSSEQGLEFDQVDASQRLSSLKFQTSEESHRSMGEFVTALGSRLRSVISSFTDLRNENKQLKSLEKEIRSSLKSNDLQWSVSGLQEKMKLLMTEITEMSSALGIATSLSLPKFRNGNEEVGTNVLSLARLAEALSNLCKEIGTALATRNTEMDKLRSLEFQIKSTNVRESRLADFVAMAKEAQGLNFQARRTLNNDISRYVQEIGVPSQNSDEAIDVFFSLSKSTAKYLDQIQANMAKLGLEIDRLKQAAAETGATGDEAERQGFRMTVSKNTQLTDRVKTLEAENQRLREEVEEGTKTTRTTSRVRMETSTRREDREEAETLRTEVTRYKREATTAQDEVDAAKRQIRSLREQIGDLEFELERAKGRKGRDTDTKSNRSNTEVDTLEQELSRMKVKQRDAEAEWEDKVQRLKREKAEAESEVERLKVQVDRLKKLERENEELRREVSRVRTRVVSNV